MIDDLAVFKMAKARIDGKNFVNKLLEEYWDKTSEEIYEDLKELKTILDVEKNGENKI